MLCPAPEATRITLEAAQRALHESPHPFVAMLKRGSLCVELYAPLGEDRQTPHEQDEIYVVQSGTGTFLNGGATHPFAPGDVLFVPAGVEHRFLDFTKDFVTWVVFYGPLGGEGANIASE